MAVNIVIEIPALKETCVLNFVLTPNVTETISVDLNFLLRGPI